MSLMEEIERRGNEKETNRLNNELNDLLKYFEGIGSPDLNKIIYEIDEIVESGVYNDLIVTAKEYDLSNTELHCMGKSLQPPILKLILDNSGVIDVFKSGFSSNFNIYDILGIYKLIRVIYILNIGRELDFKDEVKVYLSGLDERIIWSLDDFDSVNVTDIPDWDINYFQELENIHWSDAQSETLFNNLREFMKNLAYLSGLNSNSKISTFEYITIEEAFLKLMTSCSAINQEKPSKDTKDIIRAYETFLKLIKTDVTEYKALENRIADIGISKDYLTCKSCGYTYELKAGESADDFVKECECGGELEYRSEKGNIIPEDIFTAIIITLLIFAGLISYYAFKGFHEIWINGQGRFFVFALAIIIFVGFYFISKSVLNAFNWKMGFEISDDLDKEIIFVCKSCGNKYKLQGDLNIENIPEKCSCGGKLSCVESDEETGKTIDFRSLGRAKYIPVYAVSVFLLSLIFWALNLDFASFVHGEYKYVALSLLVLFSVYMTIAVIRLLRYFGLKIKF